MVIWHEPFFQDYRPCRRLSHLKKRPAKTVLASCCLWWDRRTRNLLPMSFIPLHQKGRNVWLITFPQCEILIRMNTQRAVLKIECNSQITSVRLLTLVHQSLVPCRRLSSPSTVLSWLLTPVRFAKEYFSAIILFWAAWGVIVYNYEVTVHEL